AVPTEAAQVGYVGDDGFVARADGVEEDARERIDGPCLLIVPRGPTFVDQGAEDLDDEGHDGEVGGGAFLDVDDADLDRAAIETGDGAAGIEPFVLEGAARIERGDITVYALEDLLIVVPGGVDGLGDDGGGDGGDAGGVGAVGLEAVVVK